MEHNLLNDYNFRNMIINYNFSILFILINISNNYYHFLQSNSMKLNLIQIF